MIVDTGSWPQLTESRTLIERSPARQGAMLVDRVLTRETGIDQQIGQRLRFDLGA